MDNNRYNILVCCHKKDFFLEGNNFMPIQVGKECSDLELGIKADNVGENISDKNKNYCELTAHYWYWKNCQHSDFVGLNHYRRYFNFDTFSFGRSYIKSSPGILTNTLPQKKLERIFSKYDIILPKREIYPFSLTDDYIYCHIKEDLEILKEVLKELEPEYVSAYEKIMENNNKLSHYNMFITRKEIFEDYSEWIFKILFEVEKRVHISEYPSQARIFGYMSERLLNIYVYKNRLSVKYLPINWVINDGRQESLILVLLRKFRNNLIFNLFGRKAFGK